MLAAERHDVVVAQIVAFHERNGRFQRFHRLRLVRDDGFHAVFLGGDVLVNLRIGTQPKRQAHNQANRHLSHDFPLAFQSVFVPAKHFDIVVEEAEEPQPNRRDNHQQQVDVAHSPEQQHGYENRHGNDDAAHRRHAHFLLAEGVDAAVAGSLSNFLALHILDKPLAKPCRNEQRENEREQCAERDVAPHSRAWNIVLL